jgi:small subunit ribosomal protein S16
MAVCIRLSRLGRLHRPYFRIVAIDKRNAREGLTNEILGSYDPALEDGKAIAVQTDRVEAWIKQGALVSEALKSLFKHHGVAIAYPPSGRAKARAKDTGGPKKDGKKFVPASRRAVRAHAAKLKTERKAKAAAEAAAAKPAEAAAEAPKA